MLICFVSKRWIWRLMSLLFCTLHKLVSTYTELHATDSITVHRRRYHIVCLFFNSPTLILFGDYRAGTIDLDSLPSLHGFVHYSACFKRHVTLKVVSFLNFKHWESVKQVRACCWGISWKSTQAKWIRLQKNKTREMTHAQAKGVTYLLSGKTTGNFSVMTEQEEFWSHDISVIFVPSL